MNEQKVNEREAFEASIIERFGDTIDLRLCANGDGEYLAWDAQVAWFAWHESSKQIIREDYRSMADSYDWQRQRLYEAAKKVVRMCRQESLHRTGSANNAESYACVRELRAAMKFCDESSNTLEVKP